jgi:hypothetical protein
MNASFPLGEGAGFRGVETANPAQHRPPTTVAGRGRVGFGWCRGLTETGGWRARWGLTRNPC